jgi:hypothetical protein
MVSSQFGALLKEFESVFNIQLEPDENNSCLINLGVGISVQIEMDRYGKLLIGSRLGAVHMGRFRDNLIRQALKSNDSTPHSTGILGFSQKSNQLILFAKLDPLQLNHHQIINLLPLFINKAKLWKEAIEKGEVPDITAANTASNKQPSGLFGLMS